MINILTTFFCFQTKVELVRLHNPWGNEAEWKGAWSDQSQEWSMISPQEKERLGITFDDDGEFWMPFHVWIMLFVVFFSNLLMNIMNTYFN